MQKVALVGSLLFALSIALGPGGRILDSLQHGIERRAQEVEVGLDGETVYRQEFFANDYLATHPLQAVTGVGVGQYYSVLNKEYGMGVGYNERGGLMPLNSTLLETALDIGGVAVGLLYAALGILFMQLRRRGFVFLSLALLFLTIQSLTIQTLLYIAVVAGIGVARLRTVQTARPAAVRPDLGPRPLRPAIQGLSRDAQ